eukprot:11079.XXX_606301_606570_1 [CDS] Oithona nana genome sequencing.
MLLSHRRSNANGEQSISNLEASAFYVYDQLQSFLRFHETQKWEASFSFSWDVRKGRLRMPFAFLIHRVQVYCFVKPPTLSDRFLVVLEG